MPTRFTITQTVSWMVNGAMFLFIAGALCLDKGIDVGAFVLLVLGLVTLPFLKGERPFSSLEKIWVMILVVSFLSYLTSFLIKDASHRQWGDLDIPVRFLLVVPAFLLMRKVVLKPQLFWYAAAIGAFVAGALGGYQHFYENVLRAKGMANHHIVFGDIGLCLGFICLAGIGFFKKQKGGWFFLVLGLLGGVIASISSGARGGWVAVPTLLLVLLWLNRDVLGLKWMFAILVASFSIGFTAYGLEQTGVKRRVDSAIYDVTKYVDEGKHTTPVGSRLKMFKTAWLLFLENPLLGRGTGAFNLGADELHAAGEVEKIPHIFVHPHNDYLNALGMRGIIGFVVLMAIYWVPAGYFFYQANRNKSSLAQAGLILALGYIHFGLSEAMLDRMFSAMFYLFAMSYLIVIYHQENGIGHKQEKVVKPQEGLELYA